MPGRSAPSACWPGCEGRAPRVAQLLNEWGGVTIAYRRRLIDAPSYTLNHEEVAKAMEEGIRFAECLSPEAVEIDLFDHAEALRLSRHSVDAAGKLQQPASTSTLPARTILVAAGTQPNTVLAREDARHVALDGRYFQAYDENGNKVKPERVAKPEAGSGADEPSARRARDQLLRRSASVALPAMS